MRYNNPTTGSEEFLLRQDCFLLPEPIVVEFVGPPGAGKSTSALAFQNYLSNKDLRVSQFSDVKRYFKSRSLISAVITILRGIGMKLGSVVWFTLVLAMNNALTVDSLKRYLKLCVYHAVLKQFKATAKTDIIILDQWIVQGLWSAILFQKNTFDLSSFTADFHDDVDWLIYFDADPYTAADRIAARSTTSSRLDKNDLSTNIRHLDRFSGALHRLFTSSFCKRKVSFTTEVPPVFNAQEFLNLLVEDSSKATRR